MMAARLQGDVGRSSTCCTSSFGNCVHLGMVSPIMLMPAFGDLLVVSYQYSTNHRVWLHMTLPAKGQVNGFLHPVLILFEAC